MNKKVREIIIVILMLLIFILVTIGIISYQNYQNKDNSMLRKPQAIKEIKKEESVEEVVVEPYTNELPKYRTENNNNDIMGRLEIPNMSIDTLVVRASDNTFYLRNSIHKQQDNLGVPFFDYRNKDLLTAKQINIYGHNTYNVNFMDRLPFIKLIKYKEKEMFDKYKEINLYLDEKLVRYELIAVKIITKDDIEHMNIEYLTDEEFVQHSNLLLNNSLYKNDNLVINKNDRLLVLQVCNYEPENTFLLVIAKERKS